MTIKPYQTIGIIGGGQLGRMTALAAKAMGYKIAVLDPNGQGPCAQVADIVIEADYGDMQAAKKLAEVSDVITYEFENIDFPALEWLEKNAYVPQGSKTIQTTQHRFREKSAIAAMGIPVAEFALISSAEDLDKHVTYPSVLKTTTLGYDGKGQVVLRSEADLPKAREQAAAAECILEKFVNFSMEISVMVVRSTTSEVTTLPVAENIHVNNILHQTIVPARISPEVEAKALAAAHKIAEGLNVVGVLGVEMFVVDGEVVINELAPRPHNSGHYSMDACVTGQFEQHVRAICGLPLGDTTLLTPVVMNNILGDHLNMNDLTDISRYMPLLKNGKLHLYGKATAKIGGKMGHINMLGDIDECRAALEASGIWQGASS